MNGSPSERYHPVITAKKTVEFRDDLAIVQTQGTVCKNWNIGRADGVSMRNNIIA